MFTVFFPLFKSDILHTFIVLLNCFYYFYRKHLNWISPLTIRVSRLVNPIDLLHTCMPMVMTVSNPGRGVLTPNFGRYLPQQGENRGYGSSSSVKMLCSGARSGSSSVKMRSSGLSSGSLGVKMWVSGTDCRTRLAGILIGR